MVTQSLDAATATAAAPATPLALFPAAPPAGLGSAQPGRHISVVPRIRRVAVDISSDNDINMKVGIIIETSRVAQPSVQPAASELVIARVPAGIVRARGRHARNDAVAKQYMRCS